MRSTLRVALALALAAPALVACAHAIDVGGTPALKVSDQNVLAAYAGAWEGRTFRNGSDAGVRWTLTQAADDDGSLTGMLTFDGEPIPPAPAKTVQIRGTAVTLLVGPYFSPITRDSVVTRAEGQIRGTQLSGTFESRSLATGKRTSGRFTATRMQRTARY